MVLSSFATRYQLGFSFQAGLVMGVVNTLAAVSICACAMNSACSRGRSAAKSAAKLAGSRKTKPSGVLTSGLEVLGNFLPEGISYWPPPEINQNISQKVGNLDLTDAEEDQIVQFLKTLTDGYFVPAARLEEQPVPSATPPGK
jgi:hypothetical protein